MDSSQGVWCRESGPVASVDEVRTEFHGFAPLGGAFATVRPARIGPEPRMPGSREGENDEPEEEAA